MAFFAGMVELANRPYRQRRDPEAEHARRRERERDLRDTWSARARYNERCEQQNAKFEQFTSPRYYAENNQLHEALRAKKEKAARLETRREKLRQLFMEDAQTHELEGMMARCTPASTPRSDLGVPLEVLRQVNADLKGEEETRRRHKAESALYDQWKRDCTPLRDAERRCNLDKVKMSWLDQQIQKRMLKEKEEEETLESLRIAKKAIEEARLEEEEFKKEAERKREALRRDLQLQMDDILKREAHSAKLKAEEEVVRLKGAELQALEDRWEEEERRRRAEQIALENQRYAKQKLALRAQHVARDLEEERLFIEQLQKAELCDKIRSESKRVEVQRSMNEFLGLVSDLKELEGKRLQHMQFTFDSEAPKVFQQFDANWRKEAELRKGLVHGILRDLKGQMDENLQRSKEEQRALLAEREEMLVRMQQQKEEIEAVHKWEERKKGEYRKCLDEQVAEKRQRERELKAIEKDKRADELDKLRCEEHRLKEEIMRMQRGQPVATHGRRRFFY